MKTLIVYDTTHGNTKKIAEEIAKEFSPNAKALRVNETTAAELQDLDLLIVGSPVSVKNAMQSITWFIYRLNSLGRKGIKALAFDTRKRSLFGGNAAKGMAKALADRGFKLMDEPRGFYIKDEKGPLLDGELVRARAWAKQIHGQLEKLS